MDYTEKTIICKDCGNLFTLSIGEQKFYEKKDITKYASVKIATLNNDAGIIGAALIWKNEV